MSIWRNKNQAAVARQFSGLASHSGNAKNMALAQAQHAQALGQMMSYGALGGASAALAGYLPEPQFKPSPHYPNILGWRSWIWDITANELRSPVQGTTWDGTELRCDRWDEADVVRGVAGIHAHLVPDDWQKLTMGEAPNAGRAYAEMREGKPRACIAISGVVERFGKFVLGVEGWRAEWAIIRKLAAPTEAIGLALEKAFPEVEIVYGDR